MYDWMAKTTQSYIRKLVKKAFRINLLKKVCYISKLSYSVLNSKEHVILKNIHIANYYSKQISLVCTT